MRNWHLSSDQRSWGHADRYTERSQGAPWGNDETSPQPEADDDSDASPSPVVIDAADDSDASPSPVVNGADDDSGASPSPVVNGASDDSDASPSPVVNDAATAPDTTAPEISTPVADVTLNSGTPPASDDTGTTPPDVSAPVTAPPAITTSEAGQAISLTRQDGPLVANDGDVIQNLDIYVDSGVAVTIDANNVTLQDVRIHYNGAGGEAEGMGVVVNGANNTIRNVEIFNAGAPAAGAEVNAEHYGIQALDAQNLTITNATIHDASTGIYLLNSPGTTLQGIEGYDMRGPMPRGQLVQFDKSGDSTLTDFSVHNDPGVAWTEDNISVYQSPNVTIQNGVIDGNNSPSGVGVMFEEGSTGSLASHVDTIHMGNGAFSAYNDNVTFDFTRSLDNVAGDQGRGASMSNALIWNTTRANVSITNSAYENAANPDNILWGEYEAAVADIQEVDFTPQTPWANDFVWA